MAAGGVAELAGIGPGMRDQLGRASSPAPSGLITSTLACAPTQGDRREVLLGVEAGALVELRHWRRGCRSWRAGGVAVGRRARDHLAGDIAAGAGAVLDHDRLAERLLEPLAEDARHHVARAAGREAEHERDRPRRIGLRLRRRAIAHRGKRRQAARLATNRFMDVLPEDRAGILERRRCNVHQSALFPMSRQGPGHGAAAGCDCLRRAHPQAQCVAAARWRRVEQRQEQSMRRRDVLHRSRWRSSRCCSAGAGLRRRTIRPRTSRWWCRSRPAAATTPWRASWPTG